MYIKMPEKRMASEMAMVPVAKKSRGEMVSHFKIYYFVQASLLIFFKGRPIGFHDPCHFCDVHVETIGFA